MHILMKIMLTLYFPNVSCRIHRNIEGKNKGMVPCAVFINLHREGVVVVCI